MLLLQQIPTESSCQPVSLTITNCTPLCFKRNPGSALLHQTGNHRSAINRIVDGNSDVFFLHLGNHPHALHLLKAQLE